MAERQTRDPTHGRIDPDIQAAVDAMQPKDIGQRVAIENTLQARRSGHRCTCMGQHDPFADCPAAVGPLQRQPQRRALHLTDDHQELIGEALGFLYVNAPLRRSEIVNACREMRLKMIVDG